MKQIWPRFRTLFGAAGENFFQIRLFFRKFVLNVSKWTPSNFGHFGGTRTCTLLSTFLYKKIFILFSITRFWAQNWPVDRLFSIESTTEEGINRKVAV